METTEVQDAGIEKPNGIIAESQAEPRRFELNRKHFTPAFPVDWPPLGPVRVKHRLRRPEPDEETEYKRLSFNKERIANNGRIKDEGFGLNGARHWLWDEISKQIAGYPGLTADKDEWVELTPELKRDMRLTDKEAAITALFDCEVTILHDQSIRTFTGGEWAVRLRLGTPGAFYASMRLRFKEWDEKQKKSFEDSASFGGAEIQGKTRLVTSSVNQSAFRALFKATLINVTADRDGEHDEITVDGEKFSMLNRDRFADAFLGEHQVDVISELVVVWRGK